MFYFAGIKLTNANKGHVLTAENGYQPQGFENQQWLVSLKNRKMKPQDQTTSLVLNLFLCARSRQGSAREALMVM